MKQPSLDNRDKIARCNSREGLVRFVKILQSFLDHALIKVKPKKVKWGMDIFQKWNLILHPTKPS